MTESGKGTQSDDAEKDETSATTYTEKNEDN